jgi:hypothetical protein
VTAWPEAAVGLWAVTMPSESYGWSVQMAKIKIEIDTESTERQDTRKGQFLAHPKISVVSAISITPSFRTSFETGVNDSSVQVHYDPSNGYKKHDLSHLVKAIQNNNSADLIATAGGMAAYEAASSAATKPFVSVTGEVPSGPPNYKGGVSLQSSPSNSARIALLNTLGFTSPEIGLFYNPNSYMIDEVSNWDNLIGTTTQTFQGGIDGNGDNNKTAYATDFTAAKIPSAIRALVISADPFFQDTKEQLIAAVNGWIAAGTAAGVNRYVCYPTQDYANTSGTTQPTAKKGTLYGPDLANAYNLLGQVAEFALNAASGSPPLIRLAPNVRQDL